MNSRLTGFLCWALSAFLVSCSIEDESDERLPKISVEFFNQSQFTVESLFLHDQPLNYKDRTNLLEEPLPPGESISDAIPPRTWYVTVYRRPNQDSDVLAYTTATAWDPTKFRRIIYYDEQFRVGGSASNAPTHRGIGMDSQSQ